MSAAGEVTSWRDGVVKWGPRTEKTRALWLAAEREFILNSHPANCPLCNGANDPDVILENHDKRWQELTVLAREAEVRAKAAHDKYHAGGYFLLVGGVPFRCAAVAATFKNKRCLYRGTDKSQKERLQLGETA